MANLWGAGWWWGVIIALGVIESVFGGMIVFGSVRTHAPRADPLRGLWGRYEQGDLTSWEFERLIRTGNAAVRAAPACAARLTRASTSEDRVASVLPSALGQLSIAAMLLMRRRPTPSSFRLSLRQERRLAVNRSAQPCRPHPASRFGAR